MAARKHLRCVRKSVMIGVTCDADAYQITCCIADDASQPLRWRLFNVDEWYASCRTALLHDRVLRRTLPYPSGSNYVWKRNHCWGRHAVAVLQRPRPYGPRVAVPHRAAASREPGHGLPHQGWKRSVVKRYRYRCDECCSHGLYRRGVIRTLPSRTPRSCRRYRSDT